LVTLGDSIMRSALRQSGPLPGPALSGDADRSTGLPIPGASHQSFATKAAEAVAKTATHAQLNPAGSPYTLRAGTLIPALLITGITSDLPGDIVVGDEDGVAVVPCGDAHAVVAAVEELMAREKARVAEIGRGVLYRAEIDESLRKKGVIE